MQAINPYNGRPIQIFTNKMRLKPLLKPYATSMTFQNRLFLLLILVIGLQLLVIGVFVHHRIADILDKEVGNRALMQARQIATRPTIIEGIETHNYDEIKAYVDELQTFYSDASFIVVGDAKGIRIAHPDPGKVGFPMVGDDNTLALINKKSYVSLSKGTLGFGMRGKAPVLNRKGDVIGIVSVGYLLNSIASWRNLYLSPVMAMLAIMLLSAIVAAYFFSRHIKKQMLNMEPDEIALSLRMESAILESVYEGVVAIDHEGLIYSINQNARRILGISSNTEQLHGTPINALITPSDFFIPGSQQTAQHAVKDEILSLNGDYVIASRVPCLLDGKALGWVISFRRKDDINTLSLQLSQVQQHAENLRVMRHEYANKLSTVAGLIQLGAYEDALKTIRKETTQQQQLVDFFITRFNNNRVAGLLLSKYIRAQELGLELILDPGCEMRKALPDALDTDALTTILGNLLDNAYEATLKNPASSKKITLLLTDAGDELVIEVADNGTGIAPAVADTLFERGVTTKKEDGHGYGMYLINRYVRHAGGYIIIDEADPVGAIISLFIPLKGPAYE
ncbi:ATP-binding protein [Tolumonas osonensis]|uniref:histidine kinase n=1 Tax=Tolumonas osonensis TaxID=675874 RepID=A0A841GD63_9GAMM|nr:sensor histidine kinase [Tolumonas osonensis]MBB6054526.1 two-component system cit operon sensor histidine kinase CitA [Tolumonas osonensis]